MTQENLAENIIEIYRQYGRQWTKLRGTYFYIRNSQTVFLSTHLNQARSQIFVAQISEQLVGFIQLYPLWLSLEMGRVWMINDLFVQADHRGKSIGQALMQQGIAFAKAHDAIYITLETGVDNLRAQQLYQKLGFVIEDGIYHLHLNCHKKATQDA